MQGAKTNPSILKNRQVALILISLLLLSSSSNTALADSGSDTARGSAKDPLLGISVDINEKVMMSDESLQAVFSLSGLSSTDTYILSWNLREGNSLQICSISNHLVRIITKRLRSGISQPIPISTYSPQASRRPVIRLRLQIQNRNLQSSVNLSHPIGPTS